MSEVKTRFIELLADKQKRDKELYSISDIERVTGIERRKLYRWRDGDGITFNKDEIRALCDFFLCEPGDLIDYTPPLDEGQEFLSVAVA